MPPHDTNSPSARPAPWQDPSLPAAARVGDLLSRMTLEEKLAQLCAVWPGSEAGGEDVAPLQHEMTASAPDTSGPEALLPHGLGQLTRAFGTAPVEPAEGAAALARTQARIMAANRFGIPAVAHEECLTGFTTWGATVFPTPLAWGASFDPALVGRAAELIGASMRAVGIHQGLSPVLDVVRDPRWGRTEESIGEDTYLVATIGTAYVRGLESSGVIATLKHLAGYSASRGARNHAPVAAGPRELADVLLPPFELALRDGGARSVMAAYNDIDGVPASADPWLMTELLRDEWGFTGTVVADYFGISFLELSHRVAGTPAEAAALALAAGVDVELPTVRCYGAPLRDAVRDGAVPEELVDRAVTRVLLQKCELGLLDPDWTPWPEALTAAGTAPAASPDGPSPAGEQAPGQDAVEPLAEARRRALLVPAQRDPDTRTGHSPGGEVDLDPEEMRAVARQLAEESVVLLANDGGVLPLADRPGGRIAVVGPLADDPAAMLGCYTFPRHVGVEHPQLPMGVEVPTLLESLREALPGTEISHGRGCPPPSHSPSGAAGDAQASPGFLTGGHKDHDAGDDRPGGPASAAEAELLSEAVELATAADVCVAVVGDRSGLFGRGTSGEGCDAPDLELPGAQGALLEALLATGTPVVLVLLSGRPYALGRYTGTGRGDEQPAVSAAVQAFFPGEEGGPAVAGVLSGRVNPSGRLPVSMPYGPGGQPWTYLAPPLGHLNEASSLDPTPLFPFGHGLSYTSFAWEDAGVGPAEAAEPGGTRCELDTDGEATVRLTVRNTGDRPGAEIVQLYLHDPVARTARPVNRLIGYARVPLGPGESAEVRFGFHADLASFTARDGRRIVEPGELELRLASSSADIRHPLTVHLSGPERTAGHSRRMVCAAMVHRLGDRAGQPDPEGADTAAGAGAGAVPLAPSGRPS